MYTIIQNPPILSIVSQQSVLCSERLPPVECLCVYFHVAAQVFWMNHCPPTVSEFCFEWPAREVKPRFVDIAAYAIGLRHPDHHWHRICNQAEPFFTLPQDPFCPEAVGDVPDDSSVHFLSIGFKLRKRGFDSELLTIQS